MESKFNPLSQIISENTYTYNIKDIVYELKMIQFDKGYISLVIKNLTNSSNSDDAINTYSSSFNFDSLIKKNEYFDKFKNIEKIYKNLTGYLKKSRFKINKIENDQNKLELIIIVLDDDMNDVDISFVLEVMKINNKTPKIVNNANINNKDILIEIEDVNSNKNIIDSNNKNEINYLKNEIKSIHQTKGYFNYKYITKKNVFEDDIYLSLKNLVTCSVCSDIMISPAICSGCSNSFCTKCLKHSNHNLTCPKGCKKSKLSHDIKTEELVSKLNFLCINGCGSIINYSDFEKHIVSTCPLLFKKFKKLDRTEKEKYKKIMNIKCFPELKGKIYE